MQKSVIGTNAGTIWQFLSKRGVLSLRELGELTKFKSNHLMLALGWLAKENKISLTQREEGTYVELMYNCSDQYY